DRNTRNLSVASLRADDRQEANRVPVARAVRSRPTTRSRNAMTGYQAIEDTIAKAFELRRRPIAIAFKDAAPAGITKFSGTVPSGCSFWRIAAEGATFYTVPSDHYNCAVGSHTHN